MKCITCESLIESANFKFKNSTDVFNIMYNFTCTTKNVIYVLICENCGEEYIGETGNQLKTRITVHRQQIRDENVRHLYVSKHIYQCGKGKFKIFPFYKIKQDDEMERKMKEKLFINKFKPQLNRDLS